MQRLRPENRRVPPRKDVPHLACAAAHRPTRGLTLIEVAAALALMVALLVTMLTIKSGLAHRRAAADRQLRAVAVADQLLASWWSDPTTFPVGRAGPVSTDPSLAWSTRQLPNPAAARLGGRIVRVEVRDPTAVLASVDVVLPPPGDPP